MLIVNSIAHIFGSAPPGKCIAITKSISHEINYQAMDSQLVQILHEQHNFKTPEARAFLALSEAVAESGDAITPAEIKESTGFRGDVPELLDFALKSGYVAKSDEAYSLTDKGKRLIDQLRDDDPENK